MKTTRADRLLSLCVNDGMSPTPVKEGKIELRASRPGLFRVDSRRLIAVNALDDIMIATRRGNTPVNAGDKLAGMRVSPWSLKRNGSERWSRPPGTVPFLSCCPM